MSGDEFEESAILVVELTTLIDARDQNPRCSRLLAGLCNWQHQRRRRRLRPLPSRQLSEVFSQFIDQHRATGTDHLAHVPRIIGLELDGSGRQFLLPAKTASCKPPSDEAVAGDEIKSRQWNIGIAVAQDARKDLAGRFDALGIGGTFREFAQDAQTALAQHTCRRFIDRSKYSADRPIGIFYVAE